MQGTTSLIIKKRLESTKYKECTYDSEQYKQLVEQITIIHAKSGKNQDFILEHFMYIANRVKKYEDILTEMQRLGQPPAKEFLKLDFGFSPNGKNTLIRSSNALPKTKKKIKRRRAKSAESNKLADFTTQQILRKEYKQHQINDCLSKLRSLQINKNKDFDDIYKRLLGSPKDISSILFNNTPNLIFEIDNFVYFLLKKRQRSSEFLNSIRFLCKENTQNTDKSRKSFCDTLVDETKPDNDLDTQKIVQKLNKLKEFSQHSYVSKNFYKELENEVFCFLTNVKQFANEKFYSDLIDRLSQIDLTCFDSSPDISKAFDVMADKLDQTSKDNVTLKQTLANTLKIIEKLQNKINTLETNQKFTKQKNSSLLFKIQQICEFTNFDKTFLE